MMVDLFSLYRVRERGGHRFDSSHNEIIPKVNLGHRRVGWKHGSWIMDRESREQAM